MEIGRGKKKREKNKRKKKKRMKEKNNRQIPFTCSRSKSKKRHARVTFRSADTFDQKQPTIDSLSPPFLSLFPIADLAVVGLGGCQGLWAWKGHRLKQIFYWYNIEIFLNILRFRFSRSKKIKCKEIWKNFFKK